MKKFGISVLLTAVIIGMGLNSCDKDQFSEEDAMNLQAKLDKQKQLEQDSLNTRNYRVSYTVNLVDASTSTLKSGSMVSAITGAKVKFVQDTMIRIQTADASGIVSFGDLKPGIANVNITLDGYSEVNYTVNLSSSSYNGGRQSSNIIPLIPVSGTATGTIKGKVVYEADLTNNAPEVAPVGTKVIAMVSAGSDALPSTGSNNIISISYDKLSLTATTDANGEFTMTVPATILGLDYDIQVSDFSFGQRLLQTTFNSRDTTGVLTIPTNFGSTFQTASAVSVGVPVIVTIGVPDYAFTQATATSVIDNSMGVNYIQNTNVGKYYANGYDFYTEIDNPAVANGGSKASVYFTSSNGHVTASINAQGSKYASNFDGSTIQIPYIRKAAKAIVDGVNGLGAITSYHVVPTFKGEFFSIENLQFLKHTGAGTGIVTSLPTVSESGYLYFSTAVKNLTAAIGTGFVAGDSLILAVKSDMSDIYTGKIYLTTGTVSAINITNEGSNYISGQVDVVISSPATGTTATASVSVNMGKISSIGVTNGGSGYSSAPTVTIVNKVEKNQAKYTATITNGQVSGFTSVNQGNGYLTVPSVTVASAIPGAGSGASAYAIVSGGKVTSLNLVNKGNGYRGNIPSASKNYSGASFINVKGSSTTIVNINLGTGNRSVEN